MSTAPLTRRPKPLGVFHCTFMGAVALGVGILLAWTGAAIADAAASNAGLGTLLQRALASSPQQIAEFLVTGVVFGGLLGGLVAFFFDLFANVPRR